MSAFDSSDEEDRIGRHETQPLVVDRIELPNGYTSLPGALYISGLPGYWFRNTRRNMMNDLKQLSEIGITDAIVRVTKGEMKKYRAPLLLSRYTQYNIQPHFHPQIDGSPPHISIAIHILCKVIDMLKEGNKVLLHCACGFGRAGVYGACLLQYLHTEMSASESIEIVRKIRGPQAVYSVSQYNFVMDFRLLAEEETERSVSR